MDWHAGTSRAMNYWEHKLAHETDAADVADELGTDAYTVVDARSRASFEAVHLPGAVHIGDPLPDGPLVVYCWGPGCNGATKACARLDAEGREVKEMLGGMEYWLREGHPVEGSRANRRAPDGLVGLVR
jgi:rhodanese-related sulfurtransferase